MIVFLILAIVLTGGYVIIKGLTKEK